MKNKGRKNRKPKSPQLGHFTVGRVDDPHMAAASREMDAALDRRWFRDHPGETERVRPPSPLERAAFGRRGYRLPEWVGGPPSLFE